jgi:hypothetical protein
VHPSKVNNLSNDAKSITDVDARTYMSLDFHMVLSKFLIVVIAFLVFSLP